MTLSLTWLIQRVNALGTNRIKIRYNIGKDGKVKTTHYDEEEKYIYPDDDF